MRKLNICIEIIKKTEYDSLQTVTHILEAFNILAELTGKPMVKNSIQEIGFESMK